MLLFRARVGNGSNGCDVACPTSGDTGLMLFALLDDLRERCLNTIPLSSYKIGIPLVTIRRKSVHQPATWKAWRVG